MAVGWFIASYRTRPDPTRAIRYCAINDFTPQIASDGGDWMESEVRGDLAIVKVRASAATLSALAAEPGIVRLPLNGYTAPLASLTNAQRIAIRDRLVAAGVPLATITEQVPNLAQATLGHLLRVWQRFGRRKVRFDGQDWVFDGPVQPSTPLTVIDFRVADG